MVIHWTTTKTPINFDFRGSWKTTGGTPYELSQVVTGKELVFSVNNHRRGTRGGKWQNGSRFALYREEFKDILTYRYQPAAGLDACWFPARNQNLGLQRPQAATSWGLLDAKGTTAIARVFPTKSVSDLGVALTELYREGIPHAPGTQIRDAVRDARTAKSLAQGSSQEFLNYQFGWLPIVSSIEQFCNAVTNSHELIKQYVDRSDTRIRRRFHFPTESETATGTFYQPSSLAPLTSAGYFSNGYASETRTVDTWFSGAFKYHVPLGNTNWDKAERFARFAKYLYGVRFDPDLVWSVAPWSWASDWFFNVGDVMSNLSNIGPYATVLEYGYVMQHIRHEQRVYHAPRPSLGCPPFLVPQFTKVTETKYRDVANPYGFGVSYDGLSNIQLAILAALGLSKGKNKNAP